jgi:hypothetical protein
MANSNELVYSKKLNPAKRNPKVTYRSSISKTFYKYLQPQSTDVGEIPREKNVTAQS